MVLWFIAAAATIAGTGVLAYPQGREGLLLIHQDANSFYEWVRSRFTETVAANASAAGGIDHQGSTSIWLLNSCTPRVQVLFSAFGIVVEAYRAYQGAQINKSLRSIADRITISNNIQVQGSGGVDGFAAHVRDFINLKIDQYDQSGGQHRFFIYHPDTQWHGTFKRLLKDDGALDDRFFGITNDLFALCRWMLCIRVDLQRQGRDQDAIQFHVLMPAYQSLVIPRPFILPKALFPLTFDGETANGEMLAWLNLPLEDLNTLNDIGNLCTLNRDTWKGPAAGVSAFYGSSAILGSGSLYATATAVAVCPPLAVPVFLTTAIAGMVTSVKAAQGAENLFREEQPVILG